MKHDTSSISPINWGRDSDGFTHVNVDSRGKCQLGIFLSGFFKAPFHHSQYGHFDSMSGYWAWVSTGMQDDSLRYTSGREARAMSRNAKFRNKDNEALKTGNFRRLIQSGYLDYLKSYPAMMESFLRNTLPFTQYFYVDNNLVFTRAQWVPEMLQELHDELISQEQPHGQDTG